MLAKLRRGLTKLFRECLGEMTAARIADLPGDSINRNGADL